MGARRKPFCDNAIGLCLLSAGHRQGAQMGVEVLTCMCWSTSSEEEEINSPS